MLTKIKIFPLEIRATKCSYVTIPEESEFCFKNLMMNLSFLRIQVSTLQLRKLMSFGLFNFTAVVQALYRATVWNVL